MEEMAKIEDTIKISIIPAETVINISEGKKYLTQRDNKLKPFGTCNTTSMIMALTYSSIALPPKQDEEQYEDVLTRFLLTDPRVLAYYAQIDPANYTLWKTNMESSKVIPPNEYHSVLAYGTNLWLNSKAVAFSTTTSINSILFALLQGRATVLSGIWSGLKHIVCAVGFSTSQENIREVTVASDIDLSKISSIIIDDPFGNYQTKYQETNGNDVRVPYKDFVAITREFNSNKKWAHMITPI